MKINKVLLGGSLTLLVTFGIFNVLNYLYHFSMARLLSLENYGTLATLFALIYIISIFSESVQVVIAKYSSSEKDLGRLNNLFRRSCRKALIISSKIFVVYLILSFILSSLIKINYSLLILDGLVVFVLALIPITRGMMQGRKMFHSLGLNMILEGIMKFSFGVLLVYIGWKVYGALLGAILAVFFAFLLSLLSIRNIISTKEKKATTEGIHQYSLPVFITTLALLAFYNIDLIIAKIVFSGETAGAYAISSVLAKTIFFGTQPISRAMFPISAGDRKERTRSNVFTSAFIFLSIIITFVLIIFYLFPELLVKIFSGRVIEQSASILFYLAMGVSLLSYANLNLFYKLSIGNKQGYTFLLLFVVMEAILLYVFSADLLQFSLAFLTSSAMLLWASVILLNK